MSSDPQLEAETCSVHIKQLSDIDKDVVTLLQSAGLAVQALAQPLSGSNLEEIETMGFVRRKEAFTTAASDYFSVLSSIDVRLRRQITALEEAHIIPAEAVTENSQNFSALSPTNAGIGPGNPGPAKGANTRKGIVTGGGLGALDVGWLNSRNGNVGKEMEAELWEEAQRLVEQLEAQRGTGHSMFQHRKQEESRTPIHQQSIANESMDES